MNYIAAVLITPIVFTMFLNNVRADEFGANEDWTRGAYYGERGTFFADVTGDGLADAIVVNNDGVYVRPSTGSSFPLEGQRQWTTSRSPSVGERGVSFSDVDRDSRADFISMTATSIQVTPSNGRSFPGANQRYWASPPYGERGTFFADVTGDGRADLIKVNNDGVYVRPSDGSQFLEVVNNWTGGPYYGQRGEFFADVTGDGKADAIVVNNDGVYVRPSDGSRFPLEGQSNWTGGPYYGQRGTFFADVTGDGRADAIVVNNDTVVVRRSGPGPCVCAGDPLPGDNHVFSTRPSPGPGSSVTATLNHNEDNLRMVIEDGARLNLRSNEMMVGLASEVEWAKEIQAWNICYRRLSSVYQERTNSNPNWMRLTRGCTGADTLVFRKPGFLGFWFDLFHLDQTQFWNFFGGKIVTFTWVKDR